MPRMTLGLILLAAAACGGRLADDTAISAEPGDAGQDADQDARMAPDHAVSDAGTMEGSAPPPASGNDPFRPGQDWFGTYTCPQGLTQLDLRIVAMHDDVIDDAEFIFDWTGGNESGSYSMTGAFDPATGIATFTPSAWISRPGPSWYMVGLSGTATTSTYGGDITSTTCGAFSVTLGS